MDPRPQFTISLFEIGDLADCCFSTFCFPCALSHSRTYLDGSSCLFNFFCLSPQASRWMTRTAYGIQGDATNDCLTATFCPCCNANQLYQTTKRNGPASSNGGSVFNSGTFLYSYGSGTFQDCLYSFFCMPCAIGTMLDRTMGMPWYLGCCCVNLCAARNLIRYQYRIRGNDFVEECAIPYATKCVGDIVDKFFPPIWCCLYGFYVAASMQLLRETEARYNMQPRPDTQSHEGRYLVGGDAPPSSLPEGFAMYYPTSVVSTGHPQQLYPYSQGLELQGMMMDSGVTHNPLGPVGYARVPATTLSPPYAYPSMDQRSLPPQTAVGVLMTSPIPPNKL